MNEEYRIESYIDGRPMTIWEMRNPVIYKKVAEIICDYNFDNTISNKIIKF